MKTKNKMSKVQFINEDDYFIIDHTKSLKVKVLALLKSKKIDWDADCILSLSDQSRLDYKGFTWKNEKVFAKLSDFGLTDCKDLDKVAIL